MKKFIVASDSLKAALKKLNQAVNEKHVLPILKNIYCKISDKEVELITTDLELTIAYRIQAEASEAFELLIPFEFLSKVVGVTKSAPITIEHPSSRKAKIICGEDVYEIGSLDKLDEYVKLPDTPKKTEMKLSAEFIKILSRALITCSKDEMRPSMTRVCLDMTENESNVVSTDASSLFKHKIELPVKSDEQVQFSSKMVKAIDGMDEIELSYNSKIVSMKGKDMTIWCKRFEDKFPNYRAVIPGYGANLTIIKQDLVDTLHKACISSSATKQTTLYLKQESDHVNFVTDDPEYARTIKSKISGSFTGTAEKISFSAKRLASILDQVEGDEVNLHIDEPHKAILVSSPTDEKYLGLLMPLMI